MGETKKVKHAGRFGSRYGRGVRDRLIEAEVKQRKLHKCPKCGFARVKRISTALYKCKKCGARFAGGAYVPETMSGKMVRKMTKQRAFLPLARELIEIREGKEKGLKQKKEEEAKEKKQPREKKKEESAGKEKGKEKKRSGEKKKPGKEEKREKVE